MLRSQPHGTSTTLDDTYSGPWVDPKKVFCSRSMPIRYKDFPENPFMVSAVFEDLKFRWSKKNIAEAIGHGHTLPLSFIDVEEYPWAGITAMVPGEADGKCAQIAQLTGCAVLTNDSDLLVYDLGAQGSVVFLNSIEMGGWSCHDPAESKIKAVRIWPASLSSRLGIANIQHFAYELDKAPHLGQAELIQRSRNTSEDTPEYRLFINEYQIDSRYGPIENVWQRLSQSLDTRLSEIFWQYDPKDLFVSGESPHMYLGILNEDHARKCAWEHGRVYRSLGYSIFNTYCPVSGRFTFIYEHARRGGRIAANRIALGDAERIAVELKYVCDRLSMAQAVFHGHFMSPTSWRAFALCEVYFLTASQVCLPDTGQLRRFFRLGYMGKKLDWADIHLFAETRAVLYSLRILKQLLEVSDLHAGVATKTRSILAELPSLHVLIRSRHEMTKEYPNFVADGFEDRFFYLWEQMLGVKPPQTQSSQKQFLHKPGGLNRSIPVEQQAKCYMSEQRCSNIYDLLSE